MTATDKAVKLLNELLAMDRVAVETLVNIRVPWAAGDHETVVFGNYDGAGMTVGILGVLNGFLDPRVAAICDVVCPDHGVVDESIPGKCPECGAPVRLGHLTGFEAYVP